MRKQTKVLNLETGKVHIMTDKEKVSSIIELDFENGGDQADDLKMNCMCLGLLYIIKIIKHHFDFSIIDEVYHRFSRHISEDQEYTLRIGLDDITYALDQKLQSSPIPPHERALYDEICKYNEDNQDYIVEGYETRFGATYEDLKIIYQHIDNTKLISPTIINTSLPSWHHSDPTPHPISELATRILKPVDGHKVLDLCTGYGAFLKNYIDHSPDPTNDKYYGIDISDELALYTKLVFEIIELDHDIRRGNIFTNILTGEYDKIFCDPPFGAKLSSATKARLKTKSPFELPASASPEWSYISVGLRHLSPNGKFVAIIPSGPLLNIKDSATRQSLVSQGLVEAIIQLPSGVIRGTNTHANLVIFSHHNQSIRMVDAHNYNLKKVFKYEATSFNPDEIYELFKSGINSENVKDVDPSEVLRNHSVLIPESYLGNWQSYEKLPNSKQLDEIAEQIFRGIQLSPKKTREIRAHPGADYTVKMISATNIQNAKIQGECVRLRDDPKKFKKYYLKNGDIVISAKGATVKSAVINTPRDNELFIPSGGIIVVRLKDGFNPFYVCAYLESKVGQYFLAELQTGTVLKLINASALAKLQIPFPDNPVHCDILSSSFQNSVDMLYSLKKQIEQIEDTNYNIFNNLCSLEG